MIIQQPYYDSRSTKWVVVCDGKEKYFSDGETAEDFYLLNRHRHSPIKPRTPDVVQDIMEEEFGTKYLITDPRSDIYLDQNK